LKLDERVPGPNTTLELRFEWIQLLVFLMPHEFDVADGTAIVEEKKKVFKQFQILLEFPLQGAAEQITMFFQARSPDGQDSITLLAVDTDKTMGR
jgi:hypothetical protein